MKKYTRTYELILSAVFAVTLIFLGGVGLAESSSHDTGFVVTPRSQSLEVGQSASFRALVDPYNCYQVGGCIGIEDVTSSANWSVSDSSVLSQTSPGVFSALDEGEISVTAKYNGQISTALITVTSSSDEDDDDASYDVVFEKRILEQPHEGHFRNNAVPIRHVFWLRGGYFAVTTSMCHRYSEDHGLWVFDESGDLVGERHTCEDSVADGEDIDDLSLWAHQWGAGNITSIAGDNGIILAGGALPYPPKLYDINNNRIEMLGSAWKLRLKPDSHSEPENDIYSSTNSRRVGGHAYVKERLVAVEYDEDNNGEVIVYSLPDFSVLNEMALDSPYSALIGQLNENYFLYKENRDDEVKIYTLSEKNELQEVSDLNFDSPAGFRYPYIVADSIAEDRVAIVEWVRTPRNDGSHLTDSEYKIHIYQMDEDGIEEIRVLDYSENPIVSPFAIAGEYFVSSTCTPSNSTSDSCQLEVWKGDQKLSSQPISPLTRIGGMAISRNGTVAVVTGRDSAVDLFRIKDFSASDDVSDSPEPTTPQTQTPQPQQLDINALMRQHGITPLRDYNFRDSATNYSQSFSNSFFNSTNQTTDNVEQRTENYTLSRPPQTIAEIRAFQCAYNIVCEGSISTTGYGNLGPKTQAKINEVFGTGDVNGTQTTIQTSGMTIQEIQELINQLLQQVAELQAQLGSQS